MLFSCILLNPYIHIILDTDGNISLIIHDEHILLGFIVLKNLFIYYYYYYQIYFFLNLFFIINITIAITITITITIRF